LGFQRLVVNREVRPEWGSDCRKNSGPIVLLQLPSP
jgi:hypothetical protein